MRKLIWVILFGLVGCAKENGSGNLKNRATNRRTSVVYLDVDGYELNSMVWNSGNYIRLLDGGIGGKVMDSVLVFVRSKFSGYNVLITTDSLVFNKAITKQIVVITKTSDWSGNRNGGLSYVNSMFDGSGAEAFVFPNLLDYNPYAIGVLVCHEIGHSVGLLDQVSYDSNCNLVSIYNKGNFDKAPIMGNALGSKDAVWWVGTTIPNCYTIQVDTLLLKNKLGLKK